MLLVHLTLLFALMFNVKGSILQTLLAAINSWLIFRFKDNRKETRASSKSYTILLSLTILSDAFPLKMSSHYSLTISLIIFIIELHHNGRSGLIQIMLVYYSITLPLVIFSNFVNTKNGKTVLINFLLTGILQDLVNTRYIKFHLNDIIEFSVLFHLFNRTKLYISTGAQIFFMCNFICWNLIQKTVLKVKIRSPTEIVTELEFYNPVQ